MGFFDFLCPKKSKEERRKERREAREAERKRAEAERLEELKEEGLDQKKEGGFSKTEPVNLSSEEIHVDIDEKVFKEEPKEVGEKSQEDPIEESAEEALKDPVEENFKEGREEVPLEKEQEPDLEKELLDQEGEEKKPPLKTTKLSEKEKNVDLEGEAFKEGNEEVETEELKLAKDLPHVEEAHEQTQEEVQDLPKGKLDLKGLENLQEGKTMDLAPTNKIKGLKVKKLDGPFYDISFICNGITYERNRIHLDILKNHLENYEKTGQLSLKSFCK